MERAEHGDDFADLNEEGREIARRAASLFRRIYAYSDRRNKRLKDVKALIGRQFGRHKVLGRDGWTLLALVESLSDVADSGNPDKALALIRGIAAVARTTNRGCDAPLDAFIFHTAEDQAPAFSNRREARHIPMTIPQLQQYALEHFPGLLIPGKSGASRLRKRMDELGFTRLNAPNPVPNSGRKLKT